MHILLLTAHSIAEYDDLRMLSDLGYDVFSIGAYTNPAEPADDKRPALPEVAYHPELADLVPDQMAAKSDLPDELLEWADVVIVHHFPAAAPDGRAGWISGNWAKFQQHRNRVIWRTCGQSNHWIERALTPFRAEGLEIVRYSPKERALPYFAGEDVLIRFGKYVDEWTGWSGEDRVVGNVTQDLMGRSAATNGLFWLSATQGLPVRPAGPGSEQIGGTGALDYDAMREYLRRIRCYLYTGTQPASYTLGLIEAMLTGVPVVSIGADWHNALPYGPQLFEGVEIVGMLPNEPDEFSDPEKVGTLLRQLLHSNLAEQLSEPQQQRARDLFDVKIVGSQWRAWLDQRQAVYLPTEPPVEVAS